MGIIRTRVLLEALKKLPEEMVLRKSEIPGLPPNMQKVTTIKDRKEEVDRDNKILTARLEATKEELEKIPGGKEALKKWKWEKSQDNGQS
jgi:hypothetical protein